MQVWIFEKGKPLVKSGLTLSHVVVGVLEPVGVVGEPLHGGEDKGGSDQH